MQQSDQVRIGAEGVSVFTIISVDEDAHCASIGSSADAPVVHIRSRTTEIGTNAEPDGVLD